MESERDSDSNSHCPFPAKSFFALDFLLSLGSLEEYQIKRQKMFSSAFANTSIESMELTHGRSVKKNKKTTTNKMPVCIPSAQRLSL